MRRPLYSRPLIPITVSFICGILITYRFPDNKSWIFLLLFSSAGLIIWQLIRNNTAVFSPLLLFFSLGCLSLLPWMRPNISLNDVSRYADTHSLEITGRICSIPIQKDGRTSLNLEVERLHDTRTSFPVAGKLRVTFRGAVEPLSRGDRISVFGRIRSTRNYNNPGGFDYRRYMAFQGIWATASVEGKRLKLLEKASSPRFKRLIESRRRHISELIAHAGEADQQAVIRALIIGERNAVPDMLRKAFARSGLGHLLAISGLHVGGVAAAAFYLLTRILSRAEFLLWNAWTKKAAALLSLIPVMLYALLSGMSPSTQRAAIMVGVFLATFFMEAEHDPMNTLALAALLILAVFPPSLFSISFQLSFSAVASIIYGLGRIKIWRSEKETVEKKTRTAQLRQRFLIFLFVSIFAIIGTLPLIMRYFNEVSLVGLPANLIGIPLIGFAVVPLGLSAVFVSFFSDAAAVMVFKLTAAVLTPGLKVVAWFADLPFAAVKTITPSWLEIGGFYILAWSALYLLTVRPENSVLPADGTFSGHLVTGSIGREKFFFRSRFLSMARWVKVRHRPAKAAAAAAFFILLLDAGYWTVKRFWHDDLRVTIIDVGQGSSSLLELPGGKCMLVDGGGFSDNTAFDMGARVIAPLLWHKKIATVNTLVLSHANSDHLNGLLYIARHFNVGDVWCTQEASNGRSYREFMEILRQNGIRIPEFKDIHRRHLIDGVELDILYPPEDFMEKKRRERWRDLNNNSLVLKVRYGETSFLFPGDIMSDAEQELVHLKHDSLKSTILIAPHHGSKTSSSQGFLEAVDPKIVVVSAGWRNHFGFPHPPVLLRYKDRACRVFRTDFHGGVGICTDGKSIRVTPHIPKMPL